MRRLTAIVLMPLGAGIVATPLAAKPVVSGICITDCDVWPVPTVFRNCSFIRCSGMFVGPNDCELFDCSIRDPGKYRYFAVARG